MQPVALDGGSLGSLRPALRPSLVQRAHLLGQEDLQRPYLASSD
jgi:hypothetical protein